MAGREPAAPSLRSLAVEAGVSSMAVSLALRNHPRISVATRKRIQDLARKRGYLPDPQLAKLMHHLRQRRTRHIQAVIAALTTMPKARMNRYCENIVRAARERAAALGFGFDLIEITSHLGKPASLRRIMRNRSIEGVVLLPMKTPVALEHLLEWEDFSVVATSHSVLSPHFHRVLPDGFESTLLACRKMTEAGRRRIGLMLSADMEERTGHHPTAAFLWHNLYGGAEPVSPLIVCAGEGKKFVEWMKRERPDAILCETEDYDGWFSWLGMGQAERPGRDILLVSGSLGGAGGSAGILQGETELGVTAVDLVAGMLQRGERGVPSCAKLTLIPGVWTGGRSF